MSTFKDSTYLVRTFDFIRFFGMPRTLLDAAFRFDMSYRSVLRYMENLSLAGVTFEVVMRKGAGYHYNFYQVKHIDLPTL